MSDQFIEIAQNFLDAYLGALAIKLGEKHYKSIVRVIASRFKLGESKESIKIDLGNLIKENGELDKGFLREWGLDDDF